MATAQVFRSRCLKARGIQLQRRRNRNMRPWLTPKQRMRRIKGSERANPKHRKLKVAVSLIFGGGDRKYENVLLGRLFCLELAF